MNTFPTWDGRYLVSNLGEGRQAENRESYSRVLFVNLMCNRTARHDIHTVCNLAKKYAKSVGLHEDGGRLNKRFTPHCCRHWYATHLRRNSMPREYIKYLH